MTQLIEFENKEGDIPRALLDQAESKVGVVFVHGFERTTIESKFKNIVEQLKGKVNLWRFGFSGVGLSDGKFEDLTVNKLASELVVAIKVFQQQCPEIKKIYLIGHSLACCIIISALATKSIIADRLILLAPAFNQQDLLRYWFARSQNKDKVIMWANYQEYLDEVAFIKDTEQDNRMIKEHYLKNQYWLENRDVNYQKMFVDIDLLWENLLIIHGLADDKVPLESNGQLPLDCSLLKIEKGDHDLQRPDMVEQYLDKVINFILNV